ncbi:acyl carrier protein [Streptomyces sp. NPDC037389]|uniref:acyl carrier protein n=1 Tax=Streptomyces sp. NPDC037389 TaxID=3155369 RepID=UPI003406C2A8
MATVEERVEKVVREQLDIGSDRIPREASFINDLGSDSLGLIELKMAFEYEFDMEIPDAEAERLTTVGAVMDYIAARQR